MFQCGSTKIRHERGQSTDLGTAGCLMKPAKSQGPLYVLTAAHVVAPGTVSPRPGDRVVDSDGNVVGQLAANTNPIVDRIDAALVELSVDANAKLGSLGVPTGWGNLFWEGMVLRGEAATSSATRGTVAAEDIDAELAYGTSSGPVTTSMPGQVACSFEFNGGDSGSVMLNPFGNVVGLVIGNFRNRGVVTPILTILEALRLRGLDVVPVVERKAPLADSTIQVPTPALAPSSLQPPWSSAIQIAPPPFEDREEALDVLAWTLWAEAATDYLKAVDSNGTRIREKAYRAVAEVIVNRVSRPERWGATVEAVCVSHNAAGTYQFTCWDPTRSQFQQIRSPVAAGSEAFRMAEWTARQVMSGWSGKLVAGSFHYYADTISEPFWAKGHKPVAQIGHHLFFNDVS